MAARSTRKITPVSLADECYNQIKPDILDGTLQWGEQLDIIHLADEFGVSRSPVIKAIDRLAHEGLVEVRPNKGSYVRTPTERDVNEVTEVRIAIEKMTCQLACAKNKHNLIAALEENEERLKPYTLEARDIPFGVFLEYDHDFHQIFAGLADNERLLEIYNVVRGQSELFRTKTYLKPQTQKALERHHEILDHIQNDRIDEAIRVLQTHIEEVRLDTLMSLEQQNGLGNQD